jgi:hypothetical protein
MHRKVLSLGVLAAVGLVLATPATSHSQPVVSRAHFEFPVTVDDCGIGTLDLSIDVFSLENLVSSPDGTLRSKFTVVDVGTAFDAGSGITYRFVDRFTQEVVIRGEQPTVETAERTLVISSGAGGLVARGVVHSTIQPDGNVVSDVDLHFVRCH